MKQITIVAFACLFFFTSCDKEAIYNPLVKAELSIEFDNVAGAADLELNAGNYTNATGESFNITKLKYYVSNFVLTNVNGNKFTVPQDDCYFLIDESIEDSHEAALEVPEGEYKTLSFIVGVDSLKSTADASERTGNLDVLTTAADMYWNTNDGYAFFKIEGTSTSIPTSGNAFAYIIGGYGGKLTATSNNIKTITLDLSTRGTAKVKTGKHTDVHLFVDVLKALNGTTNMSFATTPLINSPAAGTVVAANYQDLFTHDHTH